MEFPDGHVEKFTANTITSCLYIEVDDEGKQCVLLDGFIDYCKTDEAIREENRLEISSNGKPIVPPSDGSSVYYGKMVPPHGKH